MPNRKDILTGKKPTLRLGRINRKGTRKLINRKYGKNGNEKKGHIIHTFLTILNTVKLYHWNTKSYATHKATDELYAKMGELIDHFVEVMLGKENMGGRSKLLKGNNVAGAYVLNLSLYSSNSDFKKQIEYYKTFLIDLSKDATFNSETNVDLMAIRDEILAELNKFLYLLSLH